MTTNERDDELRVPFKYENLPGFCFRYEKMGHYLRDCIFIPNLVKTRPDDNLSYSITLKAESNMQDKITLQLGAR